MLKDVAMCVAALSIAALTAAGPASSSPHTATGVEFHLAVLSSNEAQVNVRSVGLGKIPLDATRLSFQLRSEKSGIVYFVGATSGVERRIVAPNTTWTAVVVPFALRLPSVPDGVYSLTVNTAIGSENARVSQVALGEALYVHHSYVTPIRIETKFFRMSNEWSPDAPMEYDLKSFDVDATGVPVKFDFMPQPQDLGLDAERNPLMSAGIENGFERLFPEIDDPIAENLSEEFSRRPLWTFGKFKYSCFGNVGMGMRVTLNDRHPVYMDRIIRIAQSPLQRQLGAVDPTHGCDSGCREGWHVSTDHPLVALFSSSPGEISWLRMGVVPIASPYLGTCAKGTAAFVDDWDFARTFTTEDPHAVHPEWDPGLRASMLDSTVQPGMTHEMVAFAIGYPSMPGKRTELDRKSVWIWYPGTWCEGKATFKDDKLVRFDGKSQCEIPIVIGQRPR